MSVFTHASIQHLIANVAMLALVAPTAFRALGVAGMVFVIWLAEIGGNAVQAVADTITGVHSPVIGASSIVFGLIAAIALISSHRKTLRLTVIACAVVSLILAVSVPTSQTAHASHLGGMVGGVFAASLLQRFVLNPDR